MHRWIYRGPYTILLQLKRLLCNGEYAEGFHNFSLSTAVGVNWQDFLHVRSPKGLFRRIQNIYQGFWLFWPLFEAHALGLLLWGTIASLAQLKTISSIFQGLWENCAMTHILVYWQHSLCKLARVLTRVESNPPITLKVTSLWRGDAVKWNFSYLHSM